MPPENLVWRAAEQGLPLVPCGKLQRQAAKAGNEVSRQQQVGW